MWQGLLALKNDNAVCQFHFVSGNITVARESLPCHPMPDPTYPPLRISQRMRLEQTQLDGVARKLQVITFFSNSLKTESANLTRVL